MAKKKLPSIFHHFIRTIFVPLLVFLALAVLTIVFAVVYLVGRFRPFFYVSIGFASAAVISLFVVAFLAFASFRRYYQKDLVDNTILNIQRLAKGESDFSPYRSGIMEFEEINESLDVLRHTYERAELIYDTRVKEDPHLEFHPEGPVTFASFSKELGNLLFLSQNFRNAVVEVYYDFADGDCFQEEEIVYLYNELRKFFQGEEGSYVILGQKKDKFYLYFARVENMARIREWFMDVLPQLSITRRNAEGVYFLGAKIAGVCYPFSERQEIFQDLLYAKREGKTVSFYLPTRTPSSYGEEMTTSSMNLNRMSALLSSIMPLTHDGKHNVSEESLRSILRSLVAKLKVDQAGLVIYKPDEKHYVSYLHAGLDSAALMEGNLFDNRIVDALEAFRSIDDSCYWSKRSHASNDLGLYLDMMGVGGGFVFLIREDSRTKALLYVFNNHRDFILNSYMQEALVVLASRIGSHYLSSLASVHMEEVRREGRAILMISDYHTYRVDYETRRLVSYSDDMKKIFPHIGMGEYCYKALYGRDNICDDCPLKTGNKKKTVVKKNVYETTLTLNERKGIGRSLLVHKLRDERDFEDRYDPTLLINSYSSLVDILRERFSIAERGNLLLLRIDNIGEILNNHGSEGALLVLRNFIAKSREIIGRKARFYRYDNRCIALFMPGLGQTDISSLCEKLYEASKAGALGTGESYRLDISYLCLQYPGGFPAAEDFMRNVDSYYREGEYETFKDWLYFADSDYARPASRKAYLLSVIDEKFKNNTFRAQLQPIVEVNDHRIASAEILLRVADEANNIVFNPEELIKVANDNKRMGIISQSMLHYIFNLYVTGGLSSLKPLGFERINLNTDSAYFTDETFLKQMKELLASKEMPNGFVGFEVTERDVYEHQETFASLQKEFNAMHAKLICDRYTGQYLSIEALKKLGFHKIKTDRYSSIKIEFDKSKQNAMKLLLNEARAQNIEVTIVGVENKEEFDLFRAMDDRVSMQGYYLFHPLDTPQLLSSIRDYNRVNKK